MATPRAAESLIYTAASREQPEQRLDILASPGFMGWMIAQRLSLAVTTYQIGKLLLLGAQPDGRLGLAERTWNRCMGLAIAGAGARQAQTMYMSTLYQLWRFENALPPGGVTPDGHDRLFVPQMAHTTGDIDVHDMAVERGGRLVFVNTLFGCLATVDEAHSFVPLWRPPFLSKLAAEDRCHLNGLALRDGWPAYVTAVSTSDVADGWRDHRLEGGVVIDVRRDAIVATGLSMPHSPRWHRDRLWLLNAGSGEVGWIDPARGAFKPVAFCPGFLRGLAIAGDFAIVGSSKARENRTFSGLALDDALRTRGAEATCGLYVIDLRRGEIAHWLRFEGIVDELYDVVALPGVLRPAAVGTRSDEICRTVTIGPSQG